jgi:hypothetical protein
MLCPKCGFANQDDFKFCLNCGETLPRGVTCEKCGTVNPPEYMFCMECGQSLGAPAAVPTEAGPEPPQQPPVVIIQEERKRRRGVLWALLGILLVTVMCSCLLWTGVVDLPPGFAEALPAPLGEVAEAIDNGRLPEFGPPAAQEPQEQAQQPPPAAEEPQPAPPTERPPTVAPPPPQPAGPTENPACSEDLLSLGITHTEFEYEDLSHDNLLIYLAEQPAGDYYVEASGPFLVPSPSYYGTSEYFDEEAQSWVIKIPLLHITERGETDYIFRPRGEECIVGELSVYNQCPTTEEFHAGFPYNNGCCTKGCWCKQAGQWSCWTTCNSWCAE